MSSILDSEASEVSELSDLNDEEENENHLNTKVNKRKHVIDPDSSDSEEEELANEDEMCRKEGEGWIVDEEDEGGASEESDGDGGGDDGCEDKDEEDDDLDDEDFQLIQENVGINLKKQKKRRLVFADDGDEEEISYKRSNQADRGREAVARQIFEDEDDEGAQTVQPKATNFDVSMEDDEEEEDEDDMADFIVDDRTGAPVTRPAKRIVHKDVALQQAQDIFGVDFDLSEFETLRKARAAGEEYSSESEAEYSDDEEGVKRRKRKRRDTSNLVLDDRVYEIFDPSDLERAFYSQADERIRKTDVPERFQLRQVPVKFIDACSPTYAQDLQELNDETEWIYRYAFKEEPNHKPISVIPRILETLKLIRESLFEVPFIAFYRKEYVEKDLNIKDIWRIYQLDEKWTILQQRKRSMIQLLQKLCDYFDASDQTANSLKKHVPLLIKLISCVRSSDSVEELTDVRVNYLLHYSPYVEQMRRWLKRQKEHDDSSKSEQSNEDEGDKFERNGPMIVSTDPVTGKMIRQRQARATAAYEVAQRAGLGDLVQRFGLSASQFAENVQDQYLRHDVDQCPMLPLDAAGDFLSPQFPHSNAALTAARYMLAFEISREPFVRKMMRQMFLLQAVISIRPTIRGMKEIDESHPLFTLKYINSKPIQDLLGSPVFLQIYNGERDKLLTYSIHLPADQIRGLSLVDELQRFFHQDEFSSLVQAWNEQRNLVLKQAAEEFIFPTLVRELKQKLLDGSQQAVLRICAKKLFTYLRIAPYPPDGHRSYEIDTEDTDSPFTNGRAKCDSRAGGNDGEAHISGAVWSKGARVLSFAIKSEDDARRSMVTAVHLDSNGEVVDFIHFHGLLSSRFAMDNIKKLKENDLQRLSNFMTKHRPQVAVIGCACRKALFLQEEIQRLVEELASERRLPRIHIELMEAELAVVFSRSSRACSDLPLSYTPLLRQAISLGRRLQDPLSEFAQLFNIENEILGIRWHSLQDSIPRELLLQALEIEFINRVNEVGVDVNRCLSHPHTSGVVQFISGLGPRKGLHMLKILKHKKMMLTNRMQLVTVIEFGPCVVINCAGFIKIDTGSLRDLDVDDIEILDSTRVHPESYDLAKKMAVDALEYDDTDECDPTVALEEIVQSPARLRELDLDAFAEELKRQDHGDKHITLYDIRKELNHRYRDYRAAYLSANPESIFSMVTHETPETLHVGRLLECRVLSIATRRPRPEQLDNANPTKNEINGLWMCPFCRQDNFQLLNHVWSHFDNNECPGQPVGLKVQLDNGIDGFIPLKLTDPPADKLFDLAQPGSLILCRVMKIDITKFNVELTCKSSDLKDDRHVWRPRLDPFYDYEQEERDLRSEENELAKAKSKTNPYTSRVIFHPYFKNINYDQLAAMEPEMEPGTIVIRPSRKGADHLTVSWKVDDGIMQHIDVIEKEKINSFSLGKLLIIGDEEFEDLDEIVARHVQPMVSLVRDIVTYRYYRDSSGGDRAFLGSLLQQEKSTNPDRIPYFLSSTKERPGYFILAFMPNKNPHYELFSVRPEGFRFRQLIFPTLDRMITWFKEHYNDPINYYA